MRPAQADQQLSGALSWGSWFCMIRIWTEFYYFMARVSVMGEGLSMGQKTNHLHH